MFKIKDTKTGNIFPTEFSVRKKVIDLANYLNREAKEQFRFVVIENFSQLPTHKIQ